MSSLLSPQAEDLDTGFHFILRTRAISRADEVSSENQDRRALDLAQAVTRMGGLVLDLGRLEHDPEDAVHLTCLLTVYQAATLLQSELWNEVAQQVPPPEPDAEVEMLQWESQVREEVRSRGPARLEIWLRIGGVAGEVEEAARRLWRECLEPEDEE